MRRKCWLQLLVCAVLLNIGSAMADDGFYVIAGGGGVGTKITSLPYTINYPGFYYLGGNLICPSGTGITVNSDNVTIDLMGFTMTSNAPPSDSGFFMYGRTNVEIRNGTITGFVTGVQADPHPSMASGKHRIINVRVHNNTYAGIKLYGDNNMVRGCVSSNNGNFGIYLASSGMITGCVAKGNNTGIKLSGAGSVSGNFANNNNFFNFVLGTIDTKTEIMVDRNSASGLTTNYLILSGSTGIVGLSPGTTTNAGAP